MGLFTTLCRETGLILHHVFAPVQDKRTVRKTVEEEKRGNVTLRRTTIEEIEVKRD